MSDENPSQVETCLDLSQTEASPGELGSPQEITEDTSQIESIVSSSEASELADEAKSKVEALDNAHPLCRVDEEGVLMVNDPALVDIDKLIEGKEFFTPDFDDSMADTKHAKKDKKRRSKDSAIEAITVAMKSLPPEEQVATVLSKYGELADSNKQLNVALKTIQKQVENIQKEKETMEAEHSKIILTKARLESLCRELQKQNKLIKDENVTRLKEEEERRKEVSAKFNTTLSEISNLMKENSEKNNKLRDENHDMAGRLQDLVKQYEAREQHVEKILKAKDLQVQLVDAKLAKQHIELTENKEKMLLEKKSLLEDISGYQTKLQTMSENEITLRTQLNSYMEKYEEFQTTLDRSNKIFNTFKKEMDEMTKKIKKLEKETKTWKERWEGANKALLDMVTERSELEKKMSLQARQNDQLKNLCRALQEQNNELRKQNKTSLATEAEVESLSEVLAAEEVETQVNNGKSEEVLDASIEVTNSSPTCEETEEASTEQVKEESSDVGSDEESKESAVITNTSNGVNHIDYLGVD